MEKVAVSDRLKSKRGTPVLPTPRNYTDPTRQGHLRRRALKKVGGMVRRISKPIISAIESIPRERVSNLAMVTNAAEYSYQVDVNTYEAMTKIIENVLRQEYLNGLDAYSSEFWLQDFLRPSYEAGAAAADASAITVTAGAGEAALANTVRAVVGSDTFNLGRANRIAVVGSRVFEEMKGLTDSARSDLSSTLRRGIEQGKSVQDIAKDIRERVRVSGSRATKIARTEIHHAYRKGSRDETREINRVAFDDSDFKLRMLWFSALTSTTRRTHGRRHGKHYSEQEVAQFYGEDANEINCYCSQTQVLVNMRTNEVIQQDLLDQMDEQRKEWFKEDPADLPEPG